MIFVFPTIALAIFRFPFTPGYTKYGGVRLQSPSAIECSAVKTCWSSIALNEVRINGWQYLSVAAPKLACFFTCNTHFRRKLGRVCPIMRHQNSLCESAGEVRSSRLLSNAESLDAAKRAGKPPCPRFCTLAFLDNLWPHLEQWRVRIQRCQHSVISGGGRRASGSLKA